MLRIHLFSIFTIKTSRALNRDDTDKCTLTITYSVRNRRIYPLATKSYNERLPCRYCPLNNSFQVYLLFRDVTFSFHLTDCVFILVFHYYVLDDCCVLTCVSFLFMLLTL